VSEFTWSINRSEIEVPGFSKAVGPIGALAIDFFLLFMSNQFFQNILRETNRYASQSLEAKHKDPATWKQVSIEELKGFFGLLIVLSLHKLHALRDYLSSGWANVASRCGVELIAPMDICDFDIYTDTSQQGVQHGLSYSVVTKLCKSIKGQWCAIFGDDFFT